MAKLRCFLCGGKVSNGVCTECGMPQRQHVEDYDLNKSDCDDKPLTHVHDEDFYQKEASYRQPAYAERQRKKEYQKASGTQAGKPMGIILVVVVIVVVICIASVISAVRETAAPLTDDTSWKYIFHNEFDFDREDGSTEDRSELILDDMEYEYALYSMPENGAAYDTYLTAGNYTAGCQLPEGTYELKVLYGNGTIDVEDSDNNIYIYEWLDSSTEEGYGQIVNLQLYQGAEVRISDGLELKLSSTNAQSQKLLEGIPNALTETVAVGNEPLMAGRDFPAGVYDIYSAEGFGVVDIYEESDDAGEENYIYLISQLLQSEEDADSEGRMEDYAAAVRNIILEEGMYVDGNGMPLELIPSETVYPQEGE